MMKNIVIAFLFTSFLFSCKDEKKIPDVSHIRADLSLYRFEKDFFSLDLNNLSASLDTLYRKDPAFLGNYLSIIMAFESTDTAFKYIPFFIKDSLYNSVYRDAQVKFSSFDKPLAQIKRGLQFVKHYFPNYALPSGIVTFIGPIDGYVTTLTSDNRFAIGLQAYMGKDYPAYQTAYIRSVYPEYKSRKFEPEYIPVNCLTSVIDEIYPAKYAGKPLIEQMVETGKRLYLLDQLLPELDDTLITGYTKAQLSNAYTNESSVWGHFVTNNLLYNSDPSIVRDYMTEGPYTLPLGQGSPPNIGQFTGWQIVKKWMEKTGKNLDELLKTPAKQVFEEAKYKPN
jgi:hypothetical protein